MFPLWRSSLRPWVALAFVALFVLAVRILWPFLTPLSLALLLTYILVPLVNRVERGTGWPRAAATAFVYLMLILAIALVPARLTPYVVSQVQDLGPALENALGRLGDWVANLGTLSLFGQRIDPYELFQSFSSDVLSQLVAMGTRVAGSSFSVVAGFATTFLSTVVWLLFILVISFYLVNDAPNMARYFWGLVPRSARVEVFYLTRRLDRTWNAFLRGQLLLSTLIFFATTSVLLILGVPQAIFLGLLAGLLNLVPNFGPVLSSIPAIALALVQGSTHFEMSHWLFALLVALAYIVIQQLEANLLVPRIIGGSVNLHPAVVLLGAIVGLSTIGLLGIFLAAPLLASLRVIGSFAYRKLLDPDYCPPHVLLPPDIEAIPDPTERPMVPITVAAGAGQPLPWQRWMQSNHPMPQPLAVSPNRPVPPPLEAARVRAILFDLDGTLMQLRGGQKGGSLARWLVPLAPLLPNRDPVAAARRLFVVTETPSNYALALLDRIGLDGWLRPLADRARRAKGIGTLGELHPVAGVEALLPRLAARWPLGVLTNRARRETNGFLDANALHPHFRAVTTRQDLWRFKPHPEAVRRTARLLGVAPADILMVGDMPVDMQSAKRAGAQALGVLTGFATEAELRAAGADAVVASVAEMEPLLLGGGS